MASSPSHKLGEFIGDFFEQAIIQYLRPIIDHKSYYLDYRHPRVARNNKKEVIGTDHYGNKHKLDIVVEKGGSEESFGIPKAYIEIAWRRYVKHSKNKVQEISGAVLPLVETHAKDVPFYAAVLAGEFTENALIQLRSQGFFVLYFSYDEICALFDSANISIRWNETTSDADIKKIVSAIEKLSSQAIQALRTTFYTNYSTQLSLLATTLQNALNISISQIIVTPIHGATQCLSSISDAVKYILDYNESSLAPILRYEIVIRYSNGDEYSMKCSDKNKAISFLNQYT